MAAESPIETKLEVSIELAQRLIGQAAPLLAAYWEFQEEADCWRLVLVPSSQNEEQRLIKQATELLIEAPYRSAFSLSDVAVDSRQIGRAQVLGAYIRVKPYVGRRIDTTFTGGQYFESVVPVYLAQELLTHVQVA
ncbi:hypothetical protein [Bradyrhizobium iriomotense]|uniref:hypothetical protein n=1 Tax=Bradyrhizobium iriomotense TaxID=441950 RepID=UPI001B8A2785|nr:hypothetical protein [Bradyrhizobium iriomotense]MBR1131715.1 hypothetical protein [Bradyrhizobium iriomotense]